MAILRPYLVTVTSAWEGNFIATWKTLGADTENFHVLTSPELTILRSLIGGAFNLMMCSVWCEGLKGSLAVMVRRMLPASISTAEVLDAGVMVRNDTSWAES